MSAASVPQWYRAVLLDRLLSLPKGSVVAVRRSKLKHRSTIGATYWVLSAEHHVLYHVSTEFAGKECRRLLRYERPVIDAEKVEKKMRSLRRKKESQYAIAKRKEIKELLKRSMSWTT
jgi:hypothetical protein